MPIGSGSILLQTIPVDPYIDDPAAFFAKTAPNKDTIERRTVSLGEKWDTPIPQIGVVQKFRQVITGRVVVASGGVVPTQRWPYGITDSLRFAAGGVADLFDVNGIDLHALRFARYPAYEEAVDVFPGTVGGGPAGTLIATIAAGTYDFHITTDIPIAHEEGSLIGGVFAQSNQAQLQLRRQLAVAADLFLDPSKVTFSNVTCTTHEVAYEIPRDGETGKMILPDLSRLHGLNATLDFQYNSAGQVKVPLVRSPGQMHRLFITAFDTPSTRLAPHPLAAAAKRIDSLRLMYGGNKSPLNYDPISMLQAESNQYYGGVLPYDRMCLDFIRENPLRDILLLAGVTELNAVVGVNGAATISGGLVRTVQETLYAGG